MTSGLASTVLIMGCGQSPNLAVKQEPTGLRLPAGIAQIARQTIAIQSLSAEQSSDTVQIAGTVIRQAPLLNGSLYQVQDDTGTIWVMSEASSPEPSAIVRVVGTVQVEPIRVEGIDISDFYLSEQTRTVTNGEAVDTDTDGDAKPPDANNPTNATPEDVAP
ncbi:MAG: hypothetical protein AAF609_07835 [Cyanobacteria bacterium P01_C01_bin.120]